MKLLNFMKSREDRTKKARWKNRYVFGRLEKRGLECKTILDVGAYNTLWSKMAKGLFPKAKGCLIESHYNPERVILYYLAGFLQAS